MSMDTQKRTAIGRTALYARLAAGGMRKNGRLYLPFILTGAGMVAIFYILRFLQVDPLVRSTHGGATLTSILALGSAVIAIFSLIFLFYTNSFLMRRRQREYGLYNILGMSRRDLSFLLLCETAFTAVISLVSGLLLGVVLSKLAELWLLWIVEGETSLMLSVDGSILLSAAGLYLTIYGLLYLCSLIRLWRSSTLSLLKSENTGERPPRANWALGLLGALLLGAAYYLATSIEEPISALTLFFVAVIMVIAATYLLLVSGSVVLCRILQKKKSYYYQANHFVSVSSMAFRMKRNGAGLASICILATMVLVMLSSTACLYFGAEDSLRARWPREVDVEVGMRDLAGVSDDAIGRLSAVFEGEVKAAGGTPTDRFSCRRAELYTVLEPGEVKLDPAHLVAMDLSASGIGAYVHILPLADYNTLTGQDEHLAHDEVLLDVFRSDYTADTVWLSPTDTRRVRAVCSVLAPNGEAVGSTIPTVTVVVDRLPGAIDWLLELKNERTEEHPLLLRWYYGIDTALSTDGQIALADELGRIDLTKVAGDIEWTASPAFSRAEQRADFLAMYGVLFFLGSMLSIVFVLAAVLIIYYKQICEGYEDRARFAIMRRIGMTVRDIQRSINAQLLTVFFLPLIGAGCHLAFAFPMIRRMLLLFGLDNIRLFVLTNLISFAVFALFYALVYRATSGAYFAIVSSAERE